MRSRHCTHPAKLESLPGRLFEEQVILDLIIRQPETCDSDIMDEGISGHPMP
jgi:hypothetical protein